MTRENQPLLSNGSEEGSVYLSLVIPIYNEEENISPLFERIKTSLNDIGKEYEVIFINDGSIDNSLDVLRKIRKNDDNLRIINFRRNYGQTAALQAGFDYARGEIIVTLDGDLQNDPSDIGDLLKMINDGFDIVSGWRAKRKDNLVRRIPSKSANCIINWLITDTGVRLHDYGCTLKAYRKWLSKELNIYGEMHRFIPVFAALKGAKVGEMVVKHHARIHGKTKYNLGRFFKVVLDLVTIRFFLYSITRPSHFFGKLAGLVVLFELLLCSIGYSISQFVDIGITKDAYVIVTAMTLLFAIMTIMFGVLGEIMIRSYFETKGVRPYTISSIE